MRVVSAESMVLFGPMTAGRGASCGLVQLGKVTAGRTRSDVEGVVMFLII